MERYLKTGDKIEIKGIDGHYTIKSVVGYGSSCVVYSTEFYNLNGEKTEHLLKEFNPKRINLDRKDGALVPVHKEQIVLFEELRERFKKGFEKQSELRNIPKLKNYTANIQNIYEDYGTIYIDMTETAGRSYKDVNEKSIFDLAQRIKVLAEVIGNYHKQGYLHLDIKPGNIFVRPEVETCQDVLLFDFDSLVPFTEENGTCVIGKEVAVSYTTDYAPIELLSASRRNKIGKQTDIYEIGEVFFEKLMGRHSNALEHNSWAKYDYDWDSDIFKNVNPKVKPLLDELFHKTLCSTASERFATTNELVTCLEKIIKIADPKAPYLKTSLPQNLAFFTGREAEIKTIHEKLKENDLVFLSGVGGIGKTELAKNYAHKYKDCYDAIIFAPFVSDVQMMILDDKNVPIYNFFQYPAEEPQEYFARKMRKLKELCDKGTLIIVDNLDTIENDDYKELFELGCKMLVTTRIDFSEIYSGAEYINIGELSNPFDVFNEYYEKPLSDEQQKCVEEIIDIVCGHTMTVELLAKQMKVGRVKPEKMLEKLKNGGISESGKEKVGTIKDGNVAMQSTYDHIQKLFDLSGLSEDEQYILANLSLIPFTGVSTELFYEWCELETYDTINNLIAEGWIRWDKAEDEISLHPLISEVIFSNKSTSYASYDKMLKNIIIHLHDDENRCIYSKERTERAELIFGVAENLLRKKPKSKIISRFLTNAPVVFFGYGNWRCAVSCREYSLQISLSLYGEIDKNTATAYFNLGRIYSELKDYDNAKRNYEKSLEIRRLLFGDKHEDVASTCDALGVIYSNLKQYEVAENFELDALQIREKILGEDDISVAKSYNNLGTLYCKLKKYDLAEEYLLKAIEKTSALLGEENEVLATAYNNLGVLYTKCGVLDEAEKNILKAINIYLLNFGEFYFHTGSTYFNLGNVYKKSKDFENAKACYEKALEINKVVYGENHPNTILIKEKLLRLYERNV